MIEDLFKLPHLLGFAGRSFGTGSPGRAGFGLVWPCSIMN
jgi:hypothetical protein